MIKSVHIEEGWWRQIRPCQLQVWTEQVSWGPPAALDLILTRRCLQQMLSLAGGPSVSLVLCTGVTSYPLYTRMTLYPLRLRCNCCIYRGTGREIIVYLLKMHKNTDADTWFWPNWCQYVITLVWQHHNDHFHSNVITGECEWSHCVW